MTNSRPTPQGPLQWWMIAVLLVALGVLLGRIVRAALAPALRTPEPGVEFHIAMLLQAERGSACPLHRKDPWLFHGES